MKTLRTILSAGALGVALSACGGADSDAGGTAHPVADSVHSSGKQETALSDVPQAVLEVVKAARPELDVQEAEYETRDGREYYDVGGLLPGGEEIELDMTKVDGVWTVVEIQRDIDDSLVPAPVVTALNGGVPDWEATRIIESDQGDGTIVYEFFGPGADGTVKYEVKWTDGEATLLTEEWAH